MSEPLTMAEAVPLGTVHLQRLLAAAGVRSLAIKGPAFVELGVRPPRQSNDVDLLIHPDDRDSAGAVLSQAGWTRTSHWMPSALDDVVHSQTRRHALYPVTVDVHHGFAGVFARGEAFDFMWDRRVALVLAHQEVHAPCHVDALVIEALNKFKAIRPAGWPEAAHRVVAGSRLVDLASVVHASNALGARHSAAELVVALGGTRPDGPPPTTFNRWANERGRMRSALLLWRIVRRSPQSLPRLVVEQLTMSEERARRWAEVHRTDYHSRWQVLRVRLRRLVSGR